MKARLISILAPLVIAFCVSSCMIQIKYDFPRWKCTFACDGEQQREVCGNDTYPETFEYSVPEFFIRDNGEVVFRFYDKNTGLKLQAANDAPFKNGTKYSFKRGDEYFDASFDWLYGGKEYKCASGSMTFKRSPLPSIAYTIDFEYDLTCPDGSTMEIRNGIFTVYQRVNPRNTDLGLE